MPIACCSVLLATTTAQRGSSAALQQAVAAAGKVQESRYCTSATTTTVSGLWLMAGRCDEEHAPSVAHPSAPSNIRRSSKSHRDGSLDLSPWPAAHASRSSTSTIAAVTACSPSWLESRDTCRWLITCESIAGSFGRPSCLPLVYLPMGPAVTVIPCFSSRAFCSSSTKRLFSRLISPLRFPFLLSLSEGPN